MLLKRYKSIHFQNDLIRTWLHVLSDVYETYKDIPFLQT